MFIAPAAGGRRDLFPDRTPKRRDFFHWGLVIGGDLEFCEVLTFSEGMAAPTFEKRYVEISMELLGGHPARS